MNQRKSDQLALAFDRLQPDLVLDAVERFGFRTTGQIQQLNSYENRVFDLRVEPHQRSLGPGDPTRLVAKFYRPHRWTRDGIRDEHAFLSDLATEGLEVVAPLTDPLGDTILEHEGYLVSVFPRLRGRMPDELLTQDLKAVGRTLARLHNVGAQRKAHHRPVLETRTYAREAIWRLEPFIFPELWNAYQDVADTILDALDDMLGGAELIRIHGDCHRGNLLRSDEGYFLIDFDDCMMGPVAQDFWMLLNGRWPDDDATRDFDSLAEGYLELRDLDGQVEDWFEPLRGYRVIMYSTWIAARWADPSFQKLFPGFREYNWWAEELRQLEAIARSL